MAASNSFSWIFHLLSLQSFCHDLFIALILKPSWKISKCHPRTRISASVQWFYFWAARSYKWNYPRPLKGRAVRHIWGIDTLREELARVGALLGWIHVCTLHPLIRLRHTVCCPGTAARHSNAILAHQLHEWEQSMIPGLQPSMRCFSQDLTNYSQLFQQSLLSATDLLSRESGPMTRSNTSLGRTSCPPWLCSG